MQKVKSLLTPEERLRRKKRLENKRKNFYKQLNEIYQAEQELIEERKTPEQKRKEQEEREESDRIWREYIKKREEYKKNNPVEVVKRKKLQNVYLR